MPKKSWRPKKKLDLEGIEYVIYCRKSTDDGDRQVQSIADQINRCVEYAKQNKITIANRPTDFAIFETAKDIRDEVNEQDEFNKSIYKKYKHLYIIKEKESGKVPHIRPKRRELIKRVQTGQVKGIISYSPDRQARNMLEGGEIITLVDSGQVDLKYTNFHFENNASGKMMLGFWFVFAKQYSDNIAESIDRGNRGAMERGKHMGDYKRGYMRDVQSGYLIPDGQNFVLMKEAFQKRLREGWSNEKICDWLNKSGFKKTRKSGGKADPKTIYMVWKDPVYYGIYVRQDMRQDLREVNPNFVPMITEDEYVELQMILDENTRRSKISKMNDIKDSLMPIDDGIIITEDGTKLSRNIPNLHRHQKRLLEIQKEYPDTELADIIEPHQIRFKVGNKKSPAYGLEITFADVLDFITPLLKMVKISPEGYEKYVETMKVRLADSSHSKRETITKIQFTRGKIDAQKDKFIADNLGKDRTEEEEKVYRKQLELYTSKLTALNEEMKEAEQNYDDLVETFEAVVNFFKNLGENLQDMNYVRTRYIFGIFSSNIVIDNKKRLRIKRNPLFLDILDNQFSNGAEDVIYFEHNPDAVASAQSLGITTFHYNKETKDLNALKEFLDHTLQ